MRPAVAAGHPATASAGAEVLAAGGNAADAAVAASLVSCVAETLMTGLLGGGHAIYYDAASGTVRNLDCFVSVPSGAARRWNRCPSSSATRWSTTRSARRPVRCPGSRRGSTRSGARMDVCRGPELVEPALQAARTGVAMTEGTRIVPRDARARDDDARRRRDVRARRRVARRGRPAAATRASSRRSSSSVTRARPRSTPARSRRPRSS